MKRFTKLVALACALALCLFAIPGVAAAAFDANQEIHVVSREDGSGTRSAFIELLKIEQKNDDGTKADLTTEEAVIANKTDVMLTNIATDAYAIGYVSMGSLSDAVKALPVDGAAATTENVKSGEYKVSRPFIIATKGEAEGLAKDFIAYILSAEGQAVVSNGYIPVVEGAAAYAPAQTSGKLVIGGSSSVTPIVEKLTEAYTALNPDASLEIQMSDSSAGMIGTIEGTFDIGMASRELKDSEAGLTPIVIAMDGIAVIVNPENPQADITAEQVRSIFIGETTTWSAAQ
jgi:phosphate transport system substrate-binding protein